MNCYEWVGLAGLKSGAASRAEVRSWYESVREVSPSDIARKNQTLIKYEQPLDVQFTRHGSLEWEARIPPNAQRPERGQLITLNGGEHVMVVTGVRDNGDIMVASFPTVAFGSGNDGAAGGKSNVHPYVGSLEGWLEENFRANKLESDVLDWSSIQFTFGDPAYLK